MPTTTYTHRAAATTAVAAGVLALAPVLATPAAAAPVRAQQTYACVITVDENPGQPGNMDLTVNVALNLPEQVRAGDQFSVSGDFSVQLPGEIGALFGAYFPTARVTSDGLVLPIDVGGHQQLVRTSYIDSGTIDTRRPPVVFGGAFTTDPITVPNNAGGTVGFGMPRNDSVPATSYEGTAALTAVMAAQGGIVPGYDKGTDRVSCRSNDGTSAHIGSVPIVAATAATAAASAPAALAAPLAAAPRTNRVQAAQTPAAPASGDPVPGTDPAAPAQPGAAGSDDSAQATRELADQMRLLVMNQASARESDDRVPLSVVAWGTLAIVAVSAAFTVFTNTRTKRLQRAADTRRDVDGAAGPQ